MQTVTSLLLLWRSVTENSSIQVRCLFT